MKEDKFDVASKCYEECLKRNAVKHSEMKAQYFLLGFFDGQKHPENLWISVEDRLPERINKFYSEPVLCRSYKNGKEYYCITKYDYDFEEWQGSCITHWMYIPEAPKGGES